jgi:hypothetical protein
MNTLVHTFLQSPTIGDWGFPYGANRRNHVGIVMDGDCARLFLWFDRFSFGNFVDTEKPASSDASPESV